MNLQKKIMCCATYRVADEIVGAIGFESLLKASEIGNECVCDDLFHHFLFLGFILCPEDWVHSVEDILDTSEELLHLSGFPVALTIVA